MSRVVGKVVFNSGRTLANRSYAFCSSKSLSCSAMNFKQERKDGISQTTVIVQDGLDFQELPSIVRQVKAGGFVTIQKADIDVKEVASTEECYQEDDSEVVDAFNRCSTKSGVYMLFDTIPQKEATPFVALQAFRRVVELESNQQFRNVTLHSDQSELFTNDKIFERIFEIILLSSQPDILIESLRLLNRIQFSKDCCQFKEKLFNEILIAVSEGKFSLLQVCEIVKMFASLKNKDEPFSDTDKLWIGFLDKQKELSENSVTEVYQILPLLQKSRNVVLKMLEKKLTTLWWRLPAATVAEILSIFVEIDQRPIQSLSILSRWTNMNIHVVTEDDLLQIVSGFCALCYIDGNLEKALERYIKAKSLKVKNAAVMAAVMEYCVRLRFRNTHILQGCGEYFIRYSSDLSPVFIKSLFIPFGVLDYQPSNGLKFWQVLENAITEKYVQFRPEDIIDIMLTCVYLEKYPINFIKKIFNPYFLDRLHTTQSGIALQTVRQKLVLFDIAMTLECKQYSGPLLPKDHSAKSLWQDGRLKRMINSIYDTVVNIVGHHDKVSTSVLLTQLPVVDLYVIDILLHPSGMPASMLHFNLRNNRNVFVALLIHLPEHYCSDNIHLIGPQVMRKRHLKQLGFRVISLNYIELAKLKVHPTTLHEYIVERMKHSEII